MKHCCIPILICLLTLTSPVYTYAQHIWLRPQAGVPFFLKSETGAIDAVEHRGGRGLVAVGLWYPVSSAWSFGVEYDHFIQGTEFRTDIPHPSSFGFGSTEITRLGAAAARAWPLGKTIHHRVQVGLGYNWNRSGGIDHYTTEPWDNHSSHRTTIESNTFKQAIDLTANYGLEFNLSEYFALSVFGGFRQYLSTAPLKHHVVTLTDKATGEGTTTTFHYPKLVFHAGLGLAFPL